MKKTFKLRAFTAMMLLWSFILETVSGLALYIVPPGRVANWTNWKLWGLTKHQWGAVHTIFGYVFLIFAALHFYYNWKPIISYIKRKLKAGVKMRAEMVVASVVSLLVLTSTMVSLPPFGTVMDIGETFRNSWEKSWQEPYIPHAELLTFDKFIEDVGIDKSEASGILKAKGITVTDGSRLIKDIAAENGVAPSDIYAFLKASLPDEQGHKVEQAMKSSGLGAGRGYGWKTFGNIAEDMNVSVEKILEALEEMGIEADEEEVVRVFAERNDISAYELIDKLRLMLKIE